MRFALALPALPLLLLILFIGACQPAGDQSPYRDALNEYLTHRGACIEAASFEEGFPTTVAMGNMDQAQLDLLVEAGVLEVVDTVSTTAFSQRLEGRMTDPAKKYALTELGEEHHRVQEDPARGEVHQLCYGTPHVVEIVDVGAVEEVGERETVEVSYTYEVQDVADWAADVDLLHRQPTVEREIASQENPIREDAVLVRTDEGWVHQALTADAPGRDSL